MGYTVPQTEYTIASFKATRIITGHSIEQMSKKLLDVRFHHRFGTLNSGAQNLWGLDQANIFIGLDYGLTNWMMIGVGRSTYEKTYNGYAKFHIFRQSKGEKNMPLSISLLAETDIITTPWEYPDRKNYWYRRLDRPSSCLIISV